MQKDMWKEETIKMNQMIQDTKKGNKFDFEGVWYNPAGDNCRFSLNFQVERIENSKNVLPTQKNRNKPLVGRINWTLLDTGKSLFLSWRNGSQGTGFFFSIYFFFFSFDIC